MQCGTSEGIYARCVWKSWPDGDPDLIILAVDAAAPLVLGLGIGDGDGDGTGLDLAWAGFTACG